MSWRGYVESFGIGDTVRFNRGWQGLNADYSQARGTITGFQDTNGARLAEVGWKNPTIPDLVNIANLAVVRERGRG